MRKQCVPGLSSGGRGLGMRLECKICLIELYTMFNRIYDAIMKHLGFSSILIACQISLKYTIWVTHTSIKILTSSFCSTGLERGRRRRRGPRWREEKMILTYNRPHTSRDCCSYKTAVNDCFLVRRLAVCIMWHQTDVESNDPRLLSWPGTKMAFPFSVRCTMQGLDGRGNNKAV